MYLWDPNGRPWDLNAHPSDLWIITVAYLVTLMASRVRYFLFSNDYYLQIFRVMRAMWDWNGAEWHYFQP